MKTRIDIASWKRKEHFYHFLHFEEPYSSRVVHFDVTRLFQLAKSRQRKFSQLYSYLILKAAMETEPFRLRIEGDEVYAYDSISLGGTMLRKDETFGFNYLPYAATFEEFSKIVEAEAERIEGGTGLQPHPDSGGNDLIHYSITPLVSFTGYGQARSFKLRTGVPIITVGGMESIGDRLRIPISIHVHHSLVDGLHVGRYVQLLQHLFDTFDQF